jgi:hypothetical protein
MSKAYNCNGVSTPEFRIDSRDHFTAVSKSVRELMSIGYSGQDVSYFLCGIVQLSVSRINIRNELTPKKD